jgi:hypothetical protein
MKRTLLIYLIVCWPLIAFAQDTINPYNIGQPMTIILQNTDGYYNPMKSPGGLDTRANLCNESDLLRDTNGVGNTWRDYLPIVYDSAAHKFDTLTNWAPHGTQLGVTTTWQRLFTARRDSLGHPHDIIAGGGAPGTRVTVSANEDVDFRASGRVILKSGFHVKPGAFFHAYTDPKWDTAVFSDDFNGTTLDRSKWHVAEGKGDDYGMGAECSSDSNVRIVSDPDANDGKALDMILREVPGNCDCFLTGRSFTDNCKTDTLDFLHTYKYIFSTAVLRTCPFPYASNGIPLGAPSYAHMPYGKWEIRDKIPHVQHHTNNWGGGDFEYDMNETDNGSMALLVPDIGVGPKYGPFKGVFGRRSGTDSTRVFRSSAAQWSMTNYPFRIFIDRFPYEVYFNTTTSDTCLSAAGTTDAAGGFPYALAHSTDSMTFYYERIPANVTNPLPWKVTQDDSGRWRIFSAPYRVNGTDSLRFSKDYQPTSVTLTTQTIPVKVQKTFNCHWDLSINSPVDKGFLLIDTPGLLATDVHSHTEQYQYTIKEGGEGGVNYPMAWENFNGDDTTGGYEYHTFTMELLPHELRYLVDGNVVRRVPDRLVPVGTKYYDWASTFERTALCIHPAEIDIDEDPSDSLGTDTSHTSDGKYYKSLTYQERHYFDTHLTNPGCWDVTIGGRTYHAAHHLVDYVKVWDVPADMKISGFPQ